MRAQPKMLFAPPARGAGGHYVVVVPQCDIVIVHRVDTFQNNSVTGGEFLKLLGLILDASPEQANEK